jgi:NAD(P)-dependent dehydrogenase (short-subunit alcohol dehydrogenase family)
MPDLNGKVALVTGGARGLGQETAVELANCGASVAVADRKFDAAKETAERCRAAGVDAEAFEFDQAVAESVTECVSSVVKRFGRIDALFANAGTGRFSPLIDMPKKDFDLVLQINLNGTFYVCQDVARQMIKQKSSGKMVLTASSGARVIAPQLGAYCASKAAVVNLAKHLAAELGNYRINVNAICPGVVATGMTGPMLGNEAWRRMLARETPVGRWGEPRDVAKLVAFLLSDDASYINGEDIMIDGGSTLQGAPRWFSFDYSKAHELDWEAQFKRWPYAP